MRQSSIIARTLVAIIGFTIIGLSIALYVRADIGSDPFTVLALGISGKAGISVGRANQLNSIVLLLVLLILDRSKIGLGTLLNALVVGRTMDFFLSIIPSPSSIAISWLMLAVGIVLMGLGVGIYVSADLGQGSIEGVMTTISSRRGIPIGPTRIGMDVIAVAAGALLGAAPGPGTLLGAALTGPVASITITAMRRLFGGA